MTQRIPSLDGLRAVAIATVICLHLVLRSPGTRLAAAVAPLVFDGVGLFFVLSGFLITTLLLEELQATGRISLRGFYLRRAFRILPPLYFYLAAMLLFCRVRHIAFPLRSLAGAALFFENYDPVSTLWLTEHTWSLCIEEQFYLLWPVLLIVAMRRGGRPGAARLAGCLIALAPMLRIAAYLLRDPALVHRLTYLLPTRMDALMSGCLLALLAGRPRFEGIFAYVARVWWMLPLCFYLLSGALLLRFGAVYRNTVGMTLDSVTMALFLLWAARNPGSAVGRVLNWPPVAYVGVLSYSAYLWQTFFLHPQNPTRLAQMPWALGLIWAMAWVSHRLMERPFLRLRRQLFSPGAPKRADAAIL